ncbi:MAG: hypothetical protein IJ733_19725, partial [Lachnospiraceae bacterium]|nr:hypothetical protein [Lachnospiraceae bacterium]
MKKQELFDTLTDLATEEAYNISNAIGLEDYFGVYVTMTNNFDEYIDGFYKPNKNTILHRYIKSCLLDGQWYDDIIENIPEDYVLKIHNEQLFRLFGFSFERL